MTPNRLGATGDINFQGFGRRQKWIFRFQGVLASNRPNGGEVKNQCDGFDRLMIDRTPDDKLRWAFKMYDEDNSREVDMQEMENVMVVSLPLVSDDQDGDDGEND